MSDSQSVNTNKIANASHIQNIPFADEDANVPSHLSNGDSHTTNLKLAPDNLKDIPNTIDNDVDDNISSITPLPDSHRARRKPSLTERRNVNMSLHINGANTNNKDNKEGNVPNPNSEHGDADDIDSPPTNNVRRSSLRRNSISMPTGINAMDMAYLVQAHMANTLKNDIDDDSSSAIYSIANSEATSADQLSSKVQVELESDEEEKKPIYKSPFRTKRRLSVAPLPALRLNDKEMISNDFDGQSVISNQNSITSVNSLASLLREKMQMVPSMIRKRKKVSNDFKIKVFVTILFLIITFLIGYAYIMYHEKLLAQSYFGQVKFNKFQRTIRIFDETRFEIISGRLGINLKKEQPFHCLEGDVLDDGSICLEWDGKARVYFNYEMNGPVNCYGIKWISLSENIYPVDCYDFSEIKGHWYGGGITKDNDWPFEQANFDFVPFITGDATAQEFGNALKRYFIGSAGVAILIDDQTPLHINMTRISNGDFCMKAMNDRFAFVNNFTEYPQLSYKICVGDDMKILHQQLMQQSLWDGLTESDIQSVNKTLDEPIWQISASSKDSLTEMTIYNFTEDVVALGFMGLGHVLVNEFWQTEIGDFTLDTNRFKTLKATIDVLHRRGFTVTFTIQPFISTQSINFAEAVDKKLLIYERLSERSIPALTRYKSLPSAGVLDITNNASIPWIVNKLKKLVKDYNIDSFYIDFGTAYNMPHYYQCNRSLLNPDQYKTLFTASLVDSVSIIGVSGAISIPKLPAFVSLPPVNSSWQGLQTIVPTVIEYGIIGYPFLMPGPVGGDYYVTTHLPNMLSYYSLEQPPLPSQELYIRWLQLATFLPSIRFSHLPSQYKSELVTEIARELMAIRQKHVLKNLNYYLRDAMNNGIPLIRPLWMLDVNDPACLAVSDEFSVGEELIVAPILQEGQTKREVYLPRGVWKDGIDGSLRKGNRWLHNYRVPLTKVAYFERMPDNTRF